MPMDATELETRAVAPGIFIEVIAGEQAIKWKPGTRKHGKQRANRRHRRTTRQSLGRLDLDA